MISSQNLILNTASKVETAKSSKDNLLDPVDLTANSGAKKDSPDNLNIPDANAFVLLLSQVFSNVATSVNTSTSKLTDSADDKAPSKGTDDAQNALLNINADVTQVNSNTIVPQTVLDANSIVPQTVFDANSNVPVKQDATLAKANDNPALNWIDSSSFQSISPFVAQTDVANAAKVTSDLNNKPLTADVLSTTSTVTSKTKADSTQDKADYNSDSIDNLSPNAGKFKENITQSLQQLSTAITDNGVKPEKADTLSNTANNAQMSALLNQPVREQVSQQKALEIPVPVTNPQWGDKFSDHVVWLGQNDVKSAVINIHPEELGPLEINVKVVKDTATVTIASHSAQVRDIVDQAIPRLREMMADQGIHLSDVQINADQRSNQFSQNNGNNNEAQEDNSATGPDGETQLVSTIKKPPSDRLVDYFA
jgi:flagellar hook-length control protein FliK